MQIVNPRELQVRMPDGAWVALPLPPLANVTFGHVTIPPADGGGGTRTATIEVAVTFRRLSLRAFQRLVGTATGTPITFRRQARRRRKRQGKRA
jgi:hypothetical protein